MANSGVSVSQAAVETAMKSCTNVAQELRNAIQNLKSKYNQAGSSWKDSKYKELGDIISSCCSALAQPIEQLGDCYKSLQRLSKVISEYEGA